MEGATLLFCRYCGSLIKKGSTICQSCGNKLDVPSMVNAKDEISEGPEYVSNTGTNLNQEDLFRLFVGGKKEDYYLHKWSKGDRSWNWAAFFLSIFWLGYRKMYKPLFMMFTIFLMMDIVFILSGIDSTSFNNAIGIVVSITLGAWGNYLYRRHAVKNINLLTENNMSHEELQRVIELRGGSSWKGVWGVVGLLIIYILLVMLIFTFVPTIHKSETGQEQVKSSIQQAVSKEDITKDIEDEITDLLHENIQTLENENLDQHMSMVFIADNPSVYNQTQEMLGNMFESHDLSYEIKDIEFLSVTNREVRVRLTQTTTWEKGENFRDNESIFIHTLKPQDGKWKFFDSEIESVNYLDRNYLSYTGQNFNSNASATLQATDMFDFFITEDIDVNNDGTLETVTFRGGSAEEEGSYSNGNVEIIVEFSDGSSTAIHVIADNVPVLYLYDIDQDGWMNLFYETGYRFMMVDMYKFTPNGLEYDSTLRGSVEKFNPYEVITNEGTYGFD